jgi:copper chaperone CopZ
MCESHVNDAVRKAFSVKKVTSSHEKGEAVILAEEPIPEAQLRAVIDQTGYQVQSVTVEPYEKKGILGLFKK